MEVVIKGEGIKIGERVRGKVWYWTKRHDKDWVACSGVVKEVDKGGRDWISLIVRVRGGKFRKYKFERLKVLVAKGVGADDVRVEDAVVVAGEGRIDKEGKLEMVVVGYWGTFENWGERKWGAGVDERGGGWQWEDGVASNEAAASGEIVDRDGLPRYESVFDDEDDGEDESEIFSS